MDDVKLAKSLIDRAEEELDAAPLVDAFSLARQIERIGAIEIEGKTMYSSTPFNSARELSTQIRSAAAKVGKQYGDDTAVSVYKQTLLFDAPHNFDCYCRYLEWARDPHKKFYEPRRKQLKPLADAMQQLEYDELDVLGISMPPGTGKSTLAEFYLSWISGRHSDRASLIGSHNMAFLSGVYDEMLRILDPRGEYLWSDVFPGLSVVKTNAKDLMIDIAENKTRAKRFATLEMSSIGSGNAGKVRAQSLLYCDDLVDGIETALSRERMDKLWSQYTVDLRQRKQGTFCKELHIATRWSVNDILGRLEQEYDGDNRAKFIRCAALDENDESNFDYPYGLGMTTKFLHEQRNIMDDASFKALYMNEPIEREGQLYSKEELMRFFELPSQEPDAIISVCDTKDQGSDYCVMPIAYRYGNLYYIADFICDNGKPGLIEDRLVNILMKHKVKLSRFESNRAGGQTAERVQQKLKEKGGITKITTKWNQTSKETRIIVASPWVKEHCVFLDESCYKNNKEYRSAMNMLTNYTMAGKNAHDDVPDAMADLSDFAENMMGSVIKSVDRMRIGF